MDGLTDLITLLTLAGLGLVILAILLPYYVFRIANYTKAIRNDLKRVNRSLQILADKE